MFFPMEASTRKQTDKPAISFEVSAGLISEFYSTRQNIFWKYAPYFTGDLKKLSRIYDLSK